MKKTKDFILEKQNLEIHYEDFINKKNKNTIIILHWWWWNSQSWLEVWNMLYKAWFNVIIPDLPWFWHTKLDRVFELDDYASVVEEFIKELWLDNVILWWHSNWWAISIKIALRDKINVSRLILNNSAGVRNDTKRSWKRKLLNNFTYVIKKVLNILPPRVSWKDNTYIKKVRKLFYRIIWWHDYLNAENNLYLKETYLNMIKSDLSDLIPKIKHDTLLIWWRNDSYTPLSDGLYMRKHIKNSKLVIIEKEKHWIHLVSPEKLVNTFLSNI